jgi:thiol-disulfide isomerase/thioredoxin
VNDSRRQTLILGGAGVAAAAAGFLVGPALLRLGSDVDSKALLAARFSDLNGQPRSLADWSGRVLVCNFWATWCAPCREEIPLLMVTREKYGSKMLEVVGIAVDNAAKVRQFSASLHISYPILLAEADGLDFMRRLGNSNGGLPYTVIVDREGGLAHRKLGALSQQEIDQMLGSLLRG